MSGVVAAAAITCFLAFVAGSSAGKAIVIAASVRQAEKVRWRNRQADGEPTYHPGGWPDDDEQAWPPRWPTPGGY